jgi:chromosome segregation ATPase
VPDSENDIENRVAVLERQILRLHEQVALATSEAAAARVLASGADRDVSEVRAELRAHTQALNALRETQLEMAKQITSLDERVTSLDARVASLDARVASLDARVASLDARVASLDERVASLDGKVTKLEDKVTQGFDTLTTGMAQIMALLTPNSGSERS